MRQILFCFSMLAFLAGCARSPQPLIFQTTPAQQRALLARTRTFEVAPQQDIMSACIDTLQDMGYAVEESSSVLGLVVASRSIKQEPSGGFAASLSLGLGVAFGNWGLRGDSGDMLVSTHTHIKQRIMLYYGLPPSQQSARRRSVTLRLTIQESKHVKKRYTDGKERHKNYLQTIDDPAVYNEIFARLGKSLFLAENHVN